MPIITNSDQKSKTLKEFYQELTKEEAQFHEKQIGKSMLSFISLVDEMFMDTILYGLTSHYRLVIQKTDNWRDEWYVVVYADGNNTFQFQYRMSEIKSPWRDATISGRANSIEEAKQYLIIAMKESEGWKNNEELNNHYIELKKTNRST